jgi:hypothetical protein
LSLDLPAECGLQVVLILFLGAIADQDV